MSRRRPEWAEDLPEDAALLMDEVYSALQNGSSRLALMGARALADMTMHSVLGTDKVTFPKKLKAMEDAGFLGTKAREALGAALDAGSAAAHRGHLPSDEDLGAVMDIVEHMIHMTLLPDAAARLKANTPARTPEK